MSFDVALVDGGRRERMVDLASSCQSHREAVVAAVLDVGGPGFVVATAVVEDLDEGVGRPKLHGRTTATA
jgi:hypothetical protein